MGVGDSSNRFFVPTREAFGSRYDAEFEAVDRRRGPARQCPVCGTTVALGEWLPPFRVELALYGREFGDFCFGGGGFDFIVSERFVDVFAAERLTGLSGFEAIEVVRVRRGRHTKPPRYFHVAATESEAAMDEETSLILPGPGPCQACRQGVDAIYGFSINQRSWKGEDAFHPLGLPSQTVMSERFAAVAEKASLTGLHLVLTEEYQWDSLGTFETVDAPPGPAISVDSRKSILSVRRADLRVASLHRLPFDRSRFYEDLQDVLGSRTDPAGEHKRQLLETWRSAWLVILEAKGDLRALDQGRISYGASATTSKRQRPWLVQTLETSRYAVTVGFYIQWKPGEELWYGDKLLGLPAPSPPPVWLWERTPYHSPPPAT